MASTLDRILRQAGAPDLIETLSERLSPTDLQSLLLAVYARRSAARSPANVLADYERSRFFGAAAFPREDYALWEQAVDTNTRDRFDILTLSPMTPLGTCAAIADVDQDWSVPTARTGEVVSDPTNVLALESALRRRNAIPEAPAQHLAAMQRVVRPQAYGKAGMLAHFALLALVSTGRDRGDHRMEAEAMGRHLETHLGLFRRLLGPHVPLSVSYTLAQGLAPIAVLEALHASTKRHGAALWEETGREAADTYYAGFCFHIWADLADQRQQLADGGLVDWVAKLTANRKERTLISGCGAEGILALRLASAGG